MKVYNTLTKSKVEFIPRESGKVSIYTCGVTPYNFAHIGNARPPIFWDTVRRFLLDRGYQIEYIQNFTDVDDKIIKRSQQLEKDPLLLAEEYAQIYLEDLNALGVLPAAHYPKVSEHIPEIIALVEKLIAKDHAYELKGDVYYAVASFPEYGKLSGRTLDDLQAGARVEVNEEKRDPMDFALWKAAKTGEISWDSPWGKGRPGWHIECSAMSLKYLGSGFDLHGGGEDLVFPHHENEIAQSEGATGEPFVRYWLHNAFITVNGERMGKSMGNFSTIRDVLGKFPAKVVRFWFAGTHYRNPISFGEAELSTATRGLERLENALFNWKHLLKQELVAEVSSGNELEQIKAKLIQTEPEFVAALEDDFNTPQALASLYELIREINRWTQTENFLFNQEAKEVLTSATEVIVKLGQILGLFLENEVNSVGITEAEIEELVTQRVQAKRDKNWALADQIRNELKAEGIILEDTAQGARWKRE